MQVIKRIFDRIIKCIAWRYIDDAYSDGFVDGAEEMFRKLKKD